MYEADYAVFSSRHIAPREQKAYRNKHMELANTRLRQIRGILGAWDKIPRSQLGSQERKLMQEITLMMNAKEVGRTRFAKS
jgi:hypothetical protein